MREYGDTLFHLEPNIKDCPGGLRDVHVCRWMVQLLNVMQGTGHELETREGEEFHEAVAFLDLVRCFLHYRHERDDNILDWLAQDAAAAAGIGLAGVGQGRRRADAAYWMRFYFRHARGVERRVSQLLDDAPKSKESDAAAGVAARTEIRGGGAWIPVGARSSGIR